MDLQTALTAAEAIQKLHTRECSQHLNSPDNLPLSGMKDVETLYSLKKYIRDPESHRLLEVLCGVFDSVRRDKVKVNVEDVGKTLKTLQGRIQACIDSWRLEISSQ